MCREAPGLDKFRPDQKTPVPNFYMAGSFTAQDYIDSMEGATLSGRQAAYKILDSAQLILMQQPKTQAQLASV
jgi:zeta-carotene desaturase